MSVYITGDTFASVYSELLDSVLNYPDHVSSPRGSEIRELIQPVIRVEDPTSRFFESSVRSTPMKYTAGEFLWYFSGSNDIEFIKKYSAFWNQLRNQYTTPDNALVEGQVNSSYGYLAMTVLDASWRGRKVSQWEWCLETMLRDPDTRQAIIHINRPFHQVDWIKDFPCTLSYQFFIRKDHGGDDVRKLHIVVNMRSNDLFFGLTYDFPMFSFFQETFLANLKQLDESFDDVQLGSLTLAAGSSHIYKKDYDVIGEMLKGGISPKEPIGALTTSPVIAQRKYETIELVTSDQFVHLMNVAHGSGPSDLEDPMYDAMAKALRA